MNVNQWLSIILKATSMGQAFFSMFLQGIGSHLHFQGLVTRISKLVPVLVSITGAMVWTGVLIKLACQFFFKIFYFLGHVIDFLGFLK